MKYLDFEKHIKNEFDGAKEPVQMDVLLASLNLGKEPTRSKGFALWMILPFLILAFSVLAWKYMGASKDMQHAPLSQEASVDKNEKSETYNLAESTNQDQNEYLVTTEAQNEAPQNLNNTSEIEAKAVTNSIQEIEQAKENITSQSILNNTPVIDELQSKQSNAPYQTPTIDLNEGADQSFSSNSQTASTSSAYSNYESSTLSKINSRPARETISLTNLEESIDLLKDDEIDGNLFSRMKINCPSFDNAGWHMALIPEVGVFLPNKTIENNSTELSAAFNERLNSETTLEGIELGLYGMLVRDHVPFYIKAGVSYSRISERMDLKYEYTEMDTTIGIISTTVSGNGDTITHIYGDIITETTFKGSNRQHHYIHLFDVPISVGYSTYLAGLDIGIEGGVKVNFMTRATGNLLTTQKDYTNLSLNRLFKNRIGLSYFGGLMIGRNFGRFGDFYLAPRFTYYPNDFNNQNNPVSQRYFTVGLNVGMVYKIN